MDYLAHWGLSAPPFADGGDGALPLAGHEAALAKLRHGLLGGGTAALSGPEGTGKTHLALRLQAMFAASGWHALYVPRPLGDPADWMARLDLEPPGSWPPEGGAGAFTRLETALRRRFGAGGRTLAVVDDMQAARDPSPGDLLRALHHLHRDGQRVLRLLLVGQAGWADRLAQAGGLASLCAVKAVLEPLSPEECLYYLQARLERAGRGKGLIGQRAARRLAAAAGGRPRDLNRLADLALVIGYGLGARKLTPDLVDMAAADLGLPPPARPRYDPVDDESIEGPEGAPPPAAASPGEFEEAEDVLAALAAEG